MRLLTLSSLLLAVSFTVSAASPAPPPVQPAGAGVMGSKPETTTAPAPAASSAVASVPDLKDLKAANFASTTKTGYWFVKHYSPFCAHCIAVAPLWQALYEFYMLSSPATASSPHPASPPSFTDTYDFHFANVNCNVDGDLCHEHEVESYPMFALFKDGKLVEKFVGKTKTIKPLSEFIEKQLEKIKPGSRPAILNLPDVALGAHGVTHTKDLPLSQTSASAVSPGTAAPLAPMDRAAKDAKDALASKRPIPNQEGVSVNLDASEFQRRITNTHDGWFVKFYAPWCGHCQAMSGAWRVLGAEMKGELNIGEVNCEVEKRLCKNVKVKGFPTILFFQNGEQVDYDGLRGVGDLVSWARKAADSGVKEIGDATDFEALEKKQEVIFLYFYDHATTSEDFAALDRVTMPLIGHALLYKTNSELLARKFRVTTWPKLVVSRDGRPSYYNALSPDDMRDVNRVVNWMKSVWLPIVPELTASNSHEIMNGKTVVLGILDRRREESFEIARKEIKQAAMEWMEIRAQNAKLERQELRDSKQLRIEEAEDRNDERALRNAKGIRIQLSQKREVGFAWVDGVFWERWIKQTYGVEVSTMGDRVIINDEDKKKYWDETRDGNPILPSRSSILESVREVVRHSPQMHSKSTVGRIEGFYRGVKNTGSGHPILVTIFLVFVLLVVVIYYRGRAKRAQGYHHVGLGAPGNTNGAGFLDQASSWLGSEKGGLFGSGPNAGGKFD